ncbi:MAG: four helix bundle protein [Acidobacteriota bacterium]
MVDGVRTSAQRFEDLEAWNTAIDLAANIYTLTAHYPKSEIYAMTSQMRRAAYSVSANIAEGFGRFGLKEKIQFYRIASGSLTELKSFCYLSSKLGYISSEDLPSILEDIETTHKLTNALIRSIKERVL